MSLSIGIVGLPNVGKSTLFNALVKRRLSKVGEYPFTTIKPHEGVVEIADSILQQLAKLANSEKTTFATITFVDIAGLVKGAHKGEGLGNEFLSHIRNVDVILHLTRGFESKMAEHVMGSVDVERDVRIVNTELLAKDFMLVEKLMEKEKEKDKKKLLEKLKIYLGKGLWTKSVQKSQDEKKLVAELKLLTSKPVLSVVNVSEDELGGEFSRKLKKKGFIVISAKFEADLVDLPLEDQDQYLKMYNLTESGIEKIAKAACRKLDLVTFYTIVGGRQARAWLLKSGSSALEAASLVHSDMAQGFIKMEVINAEHLLKCAGWQKAQEEGKVRLEGKDYRMKESDVVKFRFKL